MGNNQPPYTSPGRAPKTIDLGELELGLSIYGSIAILAALLCTFLMGLVLRLEDNTMRFWVITAALWTLFNLPSFFHILALKRSQAPVTSDKNPARAFNSGVTGLFIAYTLFYTLFPFEGNATPHDLRLFFGPFIAVFAIYRCLLMATFKEATRMTDYLALACSIFALGIAIVI